MKYDRTTVSLVPMDVDLNSSMSLGEPEPRGVAEQLDLARESLAQGPILDLADEMART